MTPPPSAVEETSGIPTLPASQLDSKGSLASAPGDPHATHDFAQTNPVSSETALPRIPGFEILAELGRGGMGVVYKARQEKVNRLIALKMVLGSGFSSPEARLRFLMEGEVLGRLQHPNIVQIYEVDTYEGQPYFALEYVEGGSLSGLLKRRKDLDPREVAELMETLTRAVHYAHANGVVHRDLKPANVLLADKEAKKGGDKEKKDNNSLSLVSVSPKITDFGLAKQTALGTGLTASGAVMGTPNYMAPEQAEGKTKLITPATDVYSLGAILYELLAGRPPFVADSPLDVIVKVVREEPPSVSSLRQKLPKDLVTICHKCLQKEPAKRYPTAETLADDLRRYLEDRPIHARAVKRSERVWRWCRRNPIMAGLLTSMVLVLVAGSLISTAFALDAHQKEKAALDEKWRADREAESAREEKKRADREALEAKKAQQSADVAAEQARAERNEARRLLGIQAVHEGLREVDYGDHFKGLLWFVQQMVRDPGAEHHAKTRIASYRQYLPLPTLTHQFVTQSAVWHVAFSQDGCWVVTSCERGQAQIWNTTTGKLRTPPLQHRSLVESAMFSPDGRWVVTASMDGTAQVWDASTGQRRTPPLKHKQTVRHGVFSPDGRWVLTASQDKTASVWDAETGQLRFPPLVHVHGVNSAAFSPDGRWIVTASGDYSESDQPGEARIWDATTGQPITLPLKHRKIVHRAVFSPDGRKVVTASGQEHSR